MRLTKKEANRKEKQIKHSRYKKPVIGCYCVECEKARNEWL